MADKQLTNRPHPRCLIWGFSADAVNTIAAMFPESRVITRLGEVHQLDWDVLVAAGQNVGGAELHLFVIVYGDGVLRGQAGESVLMRGYRRAWGLGGAISQAQDFKTFTDIPASFDALVTSDLLPAVREEHTHSALYSYRTFGEEVGSGPVPTAVTDVTPLLVGSDGGIIAATFERSPGVQCLTLPPDASMAWITAAINEWHKIAPKVFPQTADWTSHALAWLTPDEIQAAIAFREASAARKESEVRADAAWEAFASARQAATKGMWRLLTEGGEPLEEAITAALRDLGFTVRVMDGEWPKGQRFEDLRVTCGERDGWEAIVEIKGYTRSRGKAEDITNLVARFGKNFRRMEKRDPSAYWYIVNHDLATHPEERKPILEGSDFDLATLADNDGLAIDSVDLYRLWLDSRMGRIGLEEARAELVAATGRFVHAWIQRQAAAETD